MFFHLQLIHYIYALFADTPRQSETLGTATTSDSDGPPLASTAAIPPPVSTLSPTVSPSSSQPMDLASRFAFNLDEADDGWNQDGWFDEDDQASLEITPSSHTNYTSDHGKSPAYVHLSSN